ncbi:hypothetical protein FRUB_03779 [Fimbriiglobus ruber]|uniref:Uncharacterized protein n=1 Tax=Fimbriiglobus ruber TaxID=1908690 RepID=A0A225DJR6_9BACT|nr:hypothetical protein FRUB_03779 [Fimbriiglobus ruber]
MSAVIALLVASTFVTKGENRRDEAGKPHSIARRGYLTWLHRVVAMAVTVDWQVDQNCQACE